MTTNPDPPVRRRAKRSPTGTGRAPHRNIRVPDDEWDAADQVAASRGESVTTAIRWGLEEYRRRYGTP